METWKQAQIQKILSCYNNNAQAEANENAVGRLHEEKQETEGFQELEDEGIISDFDADNPEE